MATLHLDRLPMRDQGRDGDKAIVMDRGVMRLCYKQNGEWYCTFPDVRKIKSGFSEMGRIQWVAPRGIFVPVLASAYGIAQIEVLNIYDRVLTGLAMIEPSSLQIMRVQFQADAYAQALGIASIEKLSQHDIVLASIAMSLTEQAVKVLVPRSVTTVVAGTGIVGINKLVALEFVLLATAMNELTSTATMRVTRSVSPIISASGILGIEKLAPRDFVLASVSATIAVVSARMRVPRSVTSIIAGVGISNIEHIRSLDLWLLSSAYSQPSYDSLVRRIISSTSDVTVTGIVNIEAIRKIIRYGYFDWSIANYANMEIHENETRWIQIHDDTNTPIGARYQVDFGSIIGGQQVENTNTITIGPLSFNPYINSFGLYSASSGGTYYLNLTYGNSLGSANPATLYENQYIQINPGNLVVAAL